jgi:hypothetical protein
MMTEMRDTQHSAEGGLGDMSTGISDTEECELTTPRDGVHPVKMTVKS